jgi:phosphoglucosamine mutase
MLNGGASLFGTDGVRGRANTELTPEIAMALGRAAGEAVTGQVAIGLDTRRSGPMLSAALHSGFQSVGVDTIDLGIVPSGAVSYLTRRTGATFGVVVSASHNPAEDNGIKFFGRDGSKLSDPREAAIEDRIRRGAPWKIAAGSLIGMQQALPDGLEWYLDHLVERMPYTLRGLDIALDCAHGAAFQAAPTLFTRLHAGVEVFNAEPDGTNINDGCGATHPEQLARLADGRLGLAFDGDADRLVAVDEDGVPANGDVIMAVIAKHLKDTGKLRQNTVVVTVMSNLGLRLAMDRLGIDLVETAVGDRYVLEAMREAKAEVGGEQSGHVILDERTTGDGLITALKLLEVIAATGRPLSELREVMTEFPQVLRNVRVGSKDGLDRAAALWDAVGTVEAELGHEGRVLVRPSGTEPVVRVMVEAETAPKAASIADDLAAVVRAELS